MCYLAGIRESGIVESGMLRSRETDFGAGDVLTAWDP